MSRDAELAINGINAAREELELAALNFARASTMGWYLEEDTLIRLCGDDPKRYAEQFLHNMQNAARRLLMELSAAPLPPRT